MALLAGMKDFFGFDYYHKRNLRDRLNLLGVAEAHILWKTRLGHHIQGTIREPLEAALVGQDSFCQLESWINGQEFAQFRDQPVFEQLEEAHRQFHQLGRVIVEKLKIGDRGGAETVFRNEYNQSLRRTIQGLTEINRLLQED
jgi:hypothetical protein